MNEETQKETVDAPVSTPGDRLPELKLSQMPTKNLLQIRQYEENMGAVQLLDLEFVLHTERGEIREKWRPQVNDWDDSEARLKLLANKLNDLVGGPSDTSQEWKLLGEAESHLMPPSVLDYLYDSYSHIELEAGNSLFPWELLPALKRQFMVTRSVDNPVEILGELGEGPRALLGYNADGLSSWGAAEVEIAKDAFSPHFEAHLREGKALTRKQLKRALSEGSFAVIHLIVYLTPQGLLLNDGELIWRHLERLEGTKRPGLVVLHSVTGPGSSLGELANKAGHTLLKAGVPSVLVSAWTPNPKWSEKFFSTLYGKTETSLAAALKEAREAIPKGHDLHHTEDAFFAFGDWDKPLGQVRALSIQTAQNAMTAQGSWQADYQLTFLEGPQEGSTIPLYTAALDSGRRISIGRNGPIDVDLMIEDEGLENVAVELSKDGDKLCLTNKTGVPDRVRVNQLPVANVIDLHGCDEIRLGDSTCLRLEKIDQEGVPLSDSMPQDGRYQLTVTKGSQSDLNQAHPLHARVTMVGRLPDCNVMLHDPEISRNHLVLLPRDGGFYCSGVGRAPVVLNGFPLKGEKRLRPGDTLQLSSETVLQFVDTARKK